MGAQKPLWTTIMSRGDTNYLIPYKTTCEEVTKAQIVLVDLKCPGVAQIENYSRQKIKGRMDRKNLKKQEHC